MIFKISHIVTRHFSKAFASEKFWSSSRNTCFFSCLTSFRMGKNLTTVTVSLWNVWAGIVRRIILLFGKCESFEWNVAVIVDSQNQVLHALSNTWLYYGYAHRKDVKLLKIWCCHPASCFLYQVERYQSFLPNNPEKYKWSNMVFRRTL